MFITNKNPKIKNLLVLLAIFMISFNQVKSDLSPDNVVFAINCGGDSMSDSKGVFYEKVKNICKIKKIIGHKFQWGSRIRFRWKFRFQIN